ncbi:hypothetical protein E3U23_09360 [Erythrobacter litoralis]|nr:hypothetical protein [Erythrobacter litoralis]
MLSGCLARTVVDVATLPVRAASKGVDMMTTSQSERDEKRGRELREQEERLGKLERQYDNAMDDCEDGSRRACNRAQNLYAEMQQIIPTLPRTPHTY